MNLDIDYEKKMARIQEEMRSILKAISGYAGRSV